MNFKELKVAYPVFILDKDKVAFMEGKVLSVTTPHIDTKALSTSLVVDVEADLNGDHKTYCVPADSTTAYPTGQVISTSREEIKREVDAIRIQSEQAISQYDTHQLRLEKSRNLLAELDPALKEKKETEDRFSRLENTLSELKGLFEKFGRKALTEE